MYLTEVLFCVLFTLVRCNVSTENEERMVVEAPGGTYRGHILKTRNGRNIRAFQGIPYALPPLGKLRFMDPVKMNKLEGVYEANNESRICFQTPYEQETNVSVNVGEEDCLYLNVFIPQLRREENKLLPVLVWIHGGGYFEGNPVWNGPDYLLDRDMILVSFNYRLGILGFLSRGDNVLPGNMAMKDQVMALRWVQDNIRSFGGDPESVTVGGDSAGGAAVTQHLHSPLSRGLFQRAIAQSGSIYSFWPLKSQADAKSHAERVASYLGCSFQPEDFVKCMQKMPLEELFKAVLSIRRVKNLITLDFVPVVEEDSPTAFLTRESIARGSDLPLITGVTNEESAMFFLRFGEVDEIYKNSSYLYRDRGLLLSLMASYDSHPKAEEWTDTMLSFYLDGEIINDDNVYKVVYFLSDVMFNHGLHKAARKHKGKTYVYKFSYKGEKSLEGPFYGPEQLKDSAYHGDECVYLFDVFKTSDDKGMTVEDLAMSNMMLDLWHQFILTGDPTPESKVWEESQGGHRYLDLTNQGLTMKTDMFKTRMDFFDKHDLNLLSLPPEEHV